MEQVETLLTVGEIARRLDEKIRLIEYVIRPRRIPAVGWAGHARVARTHRQRTPPHGSGSRHPPWKLVCPVNSVDP
ncbi:hypothetical protein N9B17_03760 [Rhodopirellula sp.]|nr:hypothetical protein [Rhodopirellula sp.]